MIHAVIIGFVAYVVPFRWLTYLATGLLAATLGFMLGFPLVAKYPLSGHPKAVTKGEAVRARLLPYQVTLGFTAIGVGIWGLLLNIAK